jgi:hypothetical protein
MVKMDRDSNIIWKNESKAHHDLEIRPNGDIWALTRRATILPRVDPDQPVLEDFISIFDAEGNLKRQVSLIEAFENSDEYRYLWTGRKQRVGDVFHTNTLHYLDGRIADKLPQFRAGNVLVSWLKLNTVGVVDLDKEEVVWAFSGPFEAQHDPKILENGNLLMFNNYKKGKIKSSVMEFDPITQQKVWEYVGTPKKPFFSRT